jgi:hypothetical protein
VYESDLIGVEYENLDPTNSYDFVVDIDVERAGGATRIVDYLRGIL